MGRGAGSPARPRWSQTSRQRPRWPAGVNPSPQARPPRRGLPPPAALPRAKPGWVPLIEQQPARSRRPLLWATPVASVRSSVSQDPPPVPAGHPPALLAEAPRASCHSRPRRVPLRTASESSPRMRAERARPPIASRSGPRPSRREALPRNFRDPSARSRLATGSSLPQHLRCPGPKSWSSPRPCLCRWRTRRRHGRLRLRPAPNPPPAHLHPAMHMAGGDEYHADPAAAAHPRTYSVVRLHDSRRFVPPGDVVATAKAMVIGSGIRRHHGR